MPRVRRCHCCGSPIGRADPERIVAIVAAAQRGGLRAVQVREPLLSARVLTRLCERLVELLAPANGLLLVNDRVDVAAGFAHGAHVGHRSLPPAAARSMLRPGQLLGFSAHDADELRQAATAGCDFALLAPVLPTTSKPGATTLGIERAAALTATSPLPVLWLGGIDERTIGSIAAVEGIGRPLGVAVRSALGDSDDPATTTARLLGALSVCGGNATTSS
ncbi:MAG: thiamine phosphate synthase [Planctomycetes bacterium]|nr:thiamine phosphate synthase [Planctomycetota bacterium]